MYIQVAVFVLKTQVVSNTIDTQGNNLNIIQFA